MLSSINNPVNLFRTQLSILNLVRVSLEPAASIFTLLILVLIYESSFDGRHLILMLIVFFLTFPGKTPTSTSVSGLFREIVTNWFVIFLILLFLGYATRSLSAFPPSLLLAWVLMTPVVLFIAQAIFSFWLPKALASQGAGRTAIIIGAGDLGQKLATQISASPFSGTTFKGFFDDRSAARLNNALNTPLLGGMAEVSNYIKQNRVDLIYLTLPLASQPRLLKLLDELHDTTASIYFVPDIFLFDLIQARIDNVNGIPVVAACETPFYGINGLIKRASDIVLSSAILFVAAPVMAAIATGVKLSSPGPVLFKQRRYGVDGREILVYKFRSMTVCEDGDEIKQATRNDQRMTTFGAFLRRTSLDELPQLVNVLQGRMSLVGPRPHAVAHNELYRKLIKGYMMRHKVKPGITGWAQVNGLRGETDTLEKMETRIEYDLDYLRHWSLMLDLQIITRTLWIIRDRNAY
jgi:putative colanic acid biosysnthesis UDP-glucose lipid carrier transferase